jgi:putative transposase
MLGFIDTLRSEGHAVESICRVLREQGCQIAARTYRSWKDTNRPVAARTLTDAQVLDAVRDEPGPSTTGGAASSPRRASTGAAR